MRLVVSCLRLLSHQNCEDDNACMHLTVNTNVLAYHATFKCRVNWCGSSVSLSPFVPPKRSNVGHDLLGVERISRQRCALHTHET